MLCATPHGPAGPEIGFRALKLGSKSLFLHSAFWRGAPAAPDLRGGRGGGPVTIIKSACRPRSEGTCHCPAMKFPVADTKIKIVKTLCIVFFRQKNSIEPIK